MSYCFLSVSLCAYMHILSLSGHPPGPVWIRGINQRLERPVMSHHVCISLQLSWKTTVDDGKPCSQSSKPAAVTHNGSVIIVHIITSQPLNLPCRQVDWRPLTGLLYSGRLLSLMQRQRERVLGSTMRGHGTQRRENLNRNLTMWDDCEWQISADVRKKFDILSKWRNDWRYSVTAIQQFVLLLQLKHKTLHEVKKKHDDTN